MPSTAKRILPVLLTVITLIVLGAARQATATPIDSFSIAITEDLSGISGLSRSLQNAMTLVAQDRPTVTINNTSTVSSISAICLQMGNSTFDFGSLILPPNSSGPTPSAYSPGNSASLHAGSDHAGIAFSSFAAQESYSFRVNIDRVADGGMSLTNYRQALASGSDPSQWAIINVTFSDGMTLHERITPADISGAAQNPTYSYFQCLSITPQTGQISLQASMPGPGGVTIIPEPGTWVLAATGAVGLALLARRQVRSRADFLPKR